MIYLGVSDYALLDFKIYIYPYGNMRSAFWYAFHLINNWVILIIIGKHNTALFFQLVCIAGESYAYR